MQKPEPGQAERAPCETLQEKHETKEEPSIFQSLGIPLILSEPLTLEQLDANRAYLLADSQGRILAAKNGKTESSDWNWAQMVDKEEHGNWIFGVTFSSPPTQESPSTILLGWPYNHVWLHSNGTLPASWQWAFWGGEKYSNSSTPDLRFYLASDNSLTTSDGTMALCEDDGDVYIGSKTSYTPIRFTIHTFFLANPAIFALGQATWPDISFSQVNVQLANYECELVDENKINSIYKNFRSSTSVSYKNDIFECDDFGFAFKAYASLQAYKDSQTLKLQRAYAVGILFGASKTGGDGHAVNFFVNYSGELKIIEPQNGKISDAARWDYTPTFMII
ncbi:lectin MOA-related protein [Pseudomonas aeruginosa]|uniref:lectin MOA-related protein n=1 Tax=Pseudomonas aeruginosa TaxID=287 RepID=UPI0003B95A2A|nr:lectin MOA-related protein [Pseudomonas aeruginosa]ERU66043.1 hypothetical protein Q089_01148 [Pseudomonas aeruginosa C48]MEA8639441.1 lectin MOA-related protein [Pseudomonas aeruginosa]MEA8644237.1 lectin MOA-related protein [Pseudomonas aeruginosa]